jgi:hypothetical protein
MATVPPLCASSVPKIALDVVLPQPLFDDENVGEEDLIERIVHVQQYLVPFTANEFEFGCKLLKVTGREGEQKPIAGWI